MGITNFDVVQAALSGQLAAYPSAARTATADGSGTGTIAAAGMLQFVTVMTVRVRVGDPVSSVVALWERHPEHPGGEVFLAGGGVFEVALTPAVEARLRDGRLVAAEDSRAAETAVAAAVERAAVAEPVAPVRSKKSAPARKGGL